VADLSGVQLHLVDTVEKAGQLMTWLGTVHEDDVIAVDTETGERPGRPKGDALSPWHGRLRLAQIGDSITGWAIPWDQWNGVFHEAMSRYTGETIYHNIAFEARWFELQSEFKLPWDRAHDTMIAAHIIDPLGSGALKTLCSQYVDARAAAMQTTLDVEMTKNGWTWGTVPINFQPYWAYGALDTVLTCRLWSLFKAKCGPGGPYRLVYDLEMGTRRVVTKMELNGAPVDLAYSQRKYDELHAYSDGVKEWAAHRFGGKSIGSNQQLVTILEGLGAELGINADELTPTGQKKADKDVLKRLLRDGNSDVVQLADAVLKQRKASKLAETYFLNFLERHIDGRVHPNVRTLGARTSRMSITDPALQTLPKGERTVREAFIATDEDSCIITSDLDQVEFRMMASLSEDPQLISLFLEADKQPDGDAFTSIMREVYADPGAHKKDPRRKKIKGMIYGRLYGAGVAKQALTAGVSEPEMKSLADAFDSRYPGVSHFQRRVEDVGMRRYREEGTAYIITKTGRRLPCDDGKAYRLVNYLIQGGAAEVFKLDLLKLDAAGLTDYLLVPVHDEIVMNVPRSEAAQIMPVVREAMTTRDGWSVPLTAGCDGPYTNWGEGVDE
jgi:DNA polymerase-1